MSRITVMYGYASQEVDGERVEGVFAECPCCGLRVFCEGEGATARDRCVHRIAEECPRAEKNTYSVEVLPALMDVA